ncbi:2Fe-2S iron-sulfur cluster binding domain-containing protein [Rhodopseudomonas sp. BR0C11]|uniref:xanthine dehydrogenase family Fe-S subunit n=1 Tax=Rhodopseudomonas sp. BR0C11 TaxID=2269370 RepID=UPI0013DF2280|nr:2Fe-2S iron-sulfur cluster-binding protein [Rhodopseudomonas sp. BR0C11]NEV78633.1 2Fe-2S iron-sulfur cluster binding domain-containing protein [Rhodopseudomonas sp. BR0C11]
MSTLAVTINRRTVDLRPEPRTSLADVVRDHLDLTGTHLGCEHGVCGACTVLIDGVPARSCITFAAACEGAAVTTIEGLDDDEIATELRAAFTREHALQCGYCTPGMLVSARDLVLRLPEADEQAIRIGMSGNLCRCTGYVGIVRAVMSVIAARRARGIQLVVGGGRTTLGPAGSGHGAAKDDLHVASSAPANVTAALPTAAIADFTPTATIEQAFEVQHPPAEVAALFGDVAAVAACLPGVALTNAADPNRIEGEIRVQVGPIAAQFAGLARIDRAEDGCSGRIIGTGNDRRSRSSTQGEIRYRLTPRSEGRVTRVDLTIGYTLAGLLAQVGRSGLVRDLARRLVDQFAANLERKLSGETVGPAQAAQHLNGLALLLGLIRARLPRWLGGTSRH